MASRRKPMQRPSFLPGYCIPGIALLWLASPLAAQGPPPAAEIIEPEINRDLETQIEKALRLDDPAERAKAVAEIEKTAGGPNAIQPILDAFGRVRLWPDQPPGGEFPADLPSGESAKVTFRLPIEYKPERAIPLIVVLPGLGETPHSAYEKAVLRLGPACQHHAFAIPARPMGGAFHQPIATTADLPALIREIRKQIHVDTDRVYLFGEAGGGDAAWIAALMHPIEFAGLIVVDAFPRIPYPEQAYTLLLPNLASLPVLSAWHVLGGESGGEASLPPAVNRAIADYARRAGLPISGVALGPGLPGMAPLPEKEVAIILGGRRPPAGATVRHWFRYPNQGDVGWLRATDLSGEVWDDDQLAIAVSPAADRDRFITGVIADKLAFLGGRIDGQYITIETKRCGGVELRLSPETVNFARPITVVCNGRKRFEGVITPTVQTLLETARETWDFQRPVVARKSFTIHPD